MASGYPTVQCSKKLRNICPKVYTQEHSFQDYLKHTEQRQPKCPSVRKWMSRNTYVQQDAGQQWKSNEFHLQTSVHLSLNNGVEEGKLTGEFRM